MPDDGGFESDLVNSLNEPTREENPNYYAYRRKQSRFAKQDIDVLVDSDRDMYYAGVECKSKQVDASKTKKANNSSASKLYFSDAFSVDKNDLHQIEHIHGFLKKTGRHGVLAIAYRRGRGKKKHFVAMPFDAVWEAFQSNDMNGITREYAEDKGVVLMNASDRHELRDMKRSEIKADFLKIFDVI